MFQTFFQTKYNIRDISMTGVQTCALPISGQGQQRRQETNGTTSHADASAQSRKPSTQCKDSTTTGSGCLQSTHRTRGEKPKIQSTHTSPQEKEQANENLGKRWTQRFLPRRSKEGQQVHENLFTLIKSEAKANPNRNDKIGRAHV